MNSYIKKCNLFPPPPTTNLHVEKTPALKTPFATQPSTSPWLPPTPRLGLPAPTAPKKQNQGRRFPLQHAQEKRRRKKKVNAMQRLHPFLLSHTRTDKMPKRQTRKKKGLKKPCWSFLPSHSLRGKKQNSVYIHDRLSNRRIREKTSSRNRRGFAALWDC